MLQFFSKQNYLVDQLYGFVDIHNHILPGIDDGAKNVEESIRLLKAFGEFGITKFICTPHIINNYYNNTPKTIKESYKKLKKELKKSKINSVELSYAAEHMIDDNFNTLLDSNQIISLNKYHLLVEMSFLQPPINYYEAIEKIISKRYFPVLAHPERYKFMHRTNKYAQNKNEGVLFQLNLLSLGGYYGKDITILAMKLLDDGMIDFLGSDIHNISQLEFLKKIKLSKKTLKKLEPIINHTIETFY